MQTTRTLARWSLVCALAVSSIAMPSSASAVDVTPQCIPGVDATSDWGANYTAKIFWNEITVTYNGCRDGARAFIVCDNFPFGTTWGYGPVVYSVGAKSEAACSGHYMRAWGFQENSNGYWVDHYHGR